MMGIPTGHVERLRWMEKEWRALKSAQKEGLTNHELQLRVYEFYRLFGELDGWLAMGNPLPEQWTRHRPR